MQQLTLNILHDQGLPSETYQKGKRNLCDIITADSSELCCHFQTTQLEKWENEVNALLFLTILKCLAHVNEQRALAAARDAHVVIQVQPVHKARVILTAGNVDGNVEWPHANACTCSGTTEGFKQVDRQQDQGRQGITAGKTRLP